MCLAIVAVQAHPRWPLVIAANRDEFHARPTQPAQPWPEAPALVAGRDLQAGGTWLGATHTGRVALLTNVREPGRQLPQAPSRGLLVEGYLRGAMSAARYAEELSATAHLYNGFNLVLADADGLWYCSNRTTPTAQRLQAGVVGLSNAALDTPWPKLTRTRDAVAAHLQSTEQLDEEQLFAILADRQRPADAALPSTGVSLEAERLLSSPFIADAVYGTRCSTLLLGDADGQWTLVERSFSAGGALAGEVRWRLGGAAGPAAFASAAGKC